MTTTFYQKLRARWSEQNTLLCVGLDPALNKLPSEFAPSKSSIFLFNRAIIDATQDLVCAFKLQIAYYSAVGAEEQLLETVRYIKQQAPGIPLILDSKRGDIGDTAEMYAQEAFVRYQADAVTVNPYMGGDTLQPFLSHEDKGVFVLCKTSNSGSGELQNLKVENEYLYEIVARKATHDWNKNKNIGLVVGGTHLSELERVREIAGDNICFLVPGVGSQGASAKEVVRVSADKNGHGLIVNSSRAILYASKGADFAKAARDVAMKTRDELRV